MSCESWGAGDGASSHASNTSRCRGHAGARAELASEWAASGGRLIEASPSGREKPPGLGDPFEVMFTPILELKARASDKVLHSA
jgi:hypothetical protein